MNRLSAWLRPLICRTFGITGSILLWSLSAASAQAALCEYGVNNDWGAGFTAYIRITNNGSSAINGWSVNWSYSDGSRVTSSWNATLSGSNPYSASALSWNASIPAGASAEFGFQGTNGAGKAQVPVVTGSVCSAVSSSSLSAASISSQSSSSPVSSASSIISSSFSSIASSTSSSSSSSIASSSTSSSSSVTGTGGQCNWYGTLYPLCVTTPSGWGWENSKSCIAASTCSAQPAPYGIVGASSSQASSLSSARSSSTSSSSSVISSSSAISSSSSVSSSSVSNSSVSSYPPIVGGCNGYATRYWDCCKAHCSWTANVPGGLEPLRACSSNNTSLSDPTVASSCDGGSAHMCWDMAPFAASPTLAFGYAATSSGDVCGRCYQLEFTGSSYNAPGDPGSAALKGKTMIVQATNIGYDVGGGQFDILVPGGGVGAFNACSAQWGIPNSELGSQYGGLLAACKQELGYNASLEQYKACLTSRCNSVFGSRGLTQMQQACLWYANWFEAADNPALKYKEVACPAELTGRSGMDRGPLNDIRNTCN